MATYFPPKFYISSFGENWVWALKSECSNSHSPVLEGGKFLEYHNLEMFCFLFWVQPPSVVTLCTEAQLYKTPMKMRACKWGFRSATARGLLCCCGFPLHWGVVLRALQRGTPRLNESSLETLLHGWWIIANRASSLFLKKKKVMDFLRNNQSSSANSCAHLIRAAANRPCCT